MNEGNGGGLPPDQTGSFRDDPHAATPTEIIAPPALAMGGGGSRTPPPPPPPMTMTRATAKTAACCACRSWSIWRSCARASSERLYGFGVVFLLCVYFSNDLFRII